MLYGADLQSSCERKREISQRMTKRDEKKKLCALLSVHESTAIGISCRHAAMERHGSTSQGGGKARNAPTKLHRGVPKAGREKRGSPKGDSWLD